VAEQFSPKPKECNEVDHLSGDRTDNRIENLRWCSHSINQRNKTGHKGVKYEYVYGLPEGFEPFHQYQLRTGYTNPFANQSKGEDQGKWRRIENGRKT
jgi:hypothetical protein